MKKLLWLVGRPVLAGSLDLAVASAAPVPTFAGTKAYPVGRIPEAIAIGDLNGDGKPDLATASSVAPTVSALVNSGGGRFRARLDYAAGRGQYSVALGHLNNDGKPDLATANYLPNTVSVLVNRPGLCTAQDVESRILRAAKKTIERANCRVGTVRRAYSRAVKRGRVVSQRPKPGTVLRGGGKVELVVSRGRRGS